MAVTKIWAIHDSVSRVVDYCTNPSKTKLSDLEQVLLYAADKEKTWMRGAAIRRHRNWLQGGVCRKGDGCRAEALRQSRRQCGLPRLPVLQDR